jgi:hypothetical protein
MANISSIAPQPQAVDASKIAQQSDVETPLAHLAAVKNSNQSAPIEKQVLTTSPSLVIARFEASLVAARPVAA